MKNMTLNLAGHYPKFSSTAGNTIVEYALCGTAVLLVCIAGLQVVGGNFASWMDILKQDMSRGVQSTASAVASQEAQLAQATAEQPSFDGLVESVTPTADDAVAEAEAAAAPPQAAGANGNTETYANQIMEQAQQSLASGNLTQEEYNTIVNLANKGHAIGQMQGLLQGALNQSGGNFDSYNNSQLNFNGQSYTPAELQALLQSTSTDFGALKQQASVLSGVLYDPAMLETISTSGNAIQNNSVLSQQVNNDATSNAGSTAQQYEAGTLGELSSDTHNESATICTTGDHQDSGTNCSN